LNYAQKESCGAQGSHLPGPACRAGVVTRRPAPRASAARARMSRAARGSPVNRTRCGLLIRESRVTNPS